MPEGTGYGPHTPFGPPPYGPPPFGPGMPQHPGSGSPAVETCFIDAELLLWRVKSAAPTFPLVTTGAPTSAGVIGAPTTSVLFGNENYYFDTFTGGRITVGGWLDSCKRYGIAFTGLLLEEKAIVFGANSDSNGIPTLARPAIDEATRTPTALLVSLPTAGTGTINVLNDQRVFGFEVNGLVNLYRSMPGCGSGLTVNGIAGFRYWDMQENLRINSTTNVIPGNAINFDGISIEGPVVLDVNDSFQTRNQFYGGQVGLNTVAYYGPWSLNLTGKVALGGMHSKLMIQGSSTLDGINDIGLATIRGGYLALASNIGNYSRDETVVIPEATAKLGYQLLPGLTGYIGYNFLFVSRVARATDQIDPIVNSSLVPTDPAYGLGIGTARPAANFAFNDFWMQGISFGLTYQY
jgi:hypothetical protein